MEPPKPLGVFLIQPPAGELLSSVEGIFRDGQQFSVDIIKSSRTGKYLLCLDPAPDQENTKPTTLTVWSNIERATCAREQVLDLLPEYTHKQLANSNTWQQFLGRLSDDDDTILGVGHFQDGQLVVDSSLDTRLDAMKSANKTLMESGSSVRFRIDGETLI